MEKVWNILVINLGSTSSKVAYCQNDKVVQQIELSHDMNDLRALKTAEDLTAFYKKNVDAFIDSLEIGMDQMDAIAVRGTGKSGSYRHGAYLLTPEMGEACQNSPIGHKGIFASTVIGSELSKNYGIPAYLYDVVPVDELPVIATVCGIADYRRKAASHTLNCRAVAREVAEQLGRDPLNVTFVISHMGGGFTTLLYKDGAIIETYSAEEGSFTPERVGRVPQSFLIDLYTNPENTDQEIQRVLKRDVGIYGHLGTSDCREVEKMIEAGDKKAKLVYEAMAYQTSKDICALGAVVSGKIDAIILTGGIAHSKMYTGMIKERVEWVAPVVVVPGAKEIEALAGGVMRVLKGEEQVNDYDDVRYRAPFEEILD